MVTEAMCQGKEKAVVGSSFEVEGAIGFEIEASSDEGERDVVEGVVIAFSEFVAPDDDCVVEEGTVGAGFRSFGESFDEVGKFSGKPSIDLG